LASKVYGSSVKQNNEDLIGHTLWESGSKPKGGYGCNFLLTVARFIATQTIVDLYYFLRNMKRGAVCYQTRLNNMRVFCNAGLKVVSANVRETLCKARRHVKIEKWRQAIFKHSVETLLTMEY
jgi:hypothetical protein